MISFILWDVDPGIIPTFEFLRWYSLCWAIGISLGYQVLRVIYRREGLSQKELDKLVVYVVLGTVIGARLGHILFYDPIYYLNNPIEILPIRINPTFQFTGLAGLASHGGVVGALFSLFLYNLKYKRNYLWIADRLMVAGALLGVFIRFGNLMNSEIIGIPSTVPWAFIFARIDQVPRHPAQLYEAVFYFLTFIFLFSLWRSGRVGQYWGLIFGLGLMLIFVQRFVIEFIKEDQTKFEEGLILNMGQTLSIPMILTGATVIIWSLKHGPTNNGLHQRN
ncbi:prolipoprotein diacylglyceryl transferase [Fulvivirgaceae bacterium BMA12]|uniref:Phosphatidylglycerol--prolipoprotein diacylglyceryl transferase n=1 Tax=Agaribacillus aureus TaxID=3051825 RepID=A0ABT8LDF1_9BACT|nr:prolipoprotein diacylglyceryl transferase [Fulvivirgaceae bacterium BMA12]